VTIVLPPTEAIDDFAVYLPQIVVERQMILPQIVKSFTATA
jgi:hypothetical protein